jgi:hypothetical protein
MEKLFWINSKQRCNPIWRILVVKLFFKISIKPMIVHFPLFQRFCLQERPNFKKKVCYDPKNPKWRQKWNFLLKYRLKRHLLHKPWTMFECSSLCIDPKHILSLWNSSAGIQDGGKISNLDQKLKTYLCYQMANFQRIFNNYFTVYILASTNNRWVWKKEFKMAVRID